MNVNDGSLYTKGLMSTHHGLCTHVLLTSFQVTLVTWYQNVEPSWIFSSKRLCWILLTPAPVAHGPHRPSIGSPLYTDAI